MPAHTHTHTHSLVAQRHSGAANLHAPLTCPSLSLCLPPFRGFILLLLLPRYAQIKRASTDSARLGVAPERICFYCFATDTHTHIHMECGRLGRLACAHTAAFTRWIHHRGIKSAWTWNRNHLKQQSHPQGEGEGEEEEGGGVAGAGAVGSSSESWPWNVAALCTP